MPLTSAFASAAATLVLSASRLMPRISFAPSVVARLAAPRRNPESACSRRRPAGSSPLPATTSSRCCRRRCAAPGGCPGLRFRISWRRTGFTADGIGAGVGGHRGVLEREADEPAGNGLTANRTSDPQDHVSGRRPHRPGRPLRPGRLVRLRRCLRLSRGLRLGATRAPREQAGHENYDGQDRGRQSERGPPSPSSPLHQRMLAPLEDGCRVGSVM